MRRAKIILESALQTIGQFDPTRIARQSSPEVNSLRVTMKSALERAFGSETVEFTRYERATRIDDGPYNYAYAVPPEEFQGTLAREKSLTTSLLQQAIADLDQELSLVPRVSEEIASVESSVLNRRVFLVHGHDHQPLEAVARFLERIGFDPIILHEQPNRGQTIIEKLERNTDVGFAVVFLTPDDVGGQNPRELKSRPRQNVLLELGFFVGSLGRDRVCAFKRGELDLPSDYDGVLWTDYDEQGGWRQVLGRELEAAGYAVDWNLVMRSVRLE